MIRIVTPGVGAVLPSAPVPLINLPAMGVPSLASTPLSFVLASGLPSLTPSVAVPNIPQATIIPVSSVSGAASQQGREPSSENAAANAGAFFDGMAASPSAMPATPPPAGDAPLGSGLRMARSEHESWLNAVVGLLTGTRTGRRVLRDIGRLAASRGVPVLLDVNPIGNNGEFRYDSDLLVMDSGHLKRDPYQSAPILAHELQHVLQRAMNLPVDALELEIESYTVENRVWTELGAKPEVGTFARPVRNRITKDLPGFVAWLGGEYENNIPLYGSTIDAYVARLNKNLATTYAAEKRTRRKRVAVERVLESMRANGMSEDSIAAHRREDLEPLDRSLRDGAVNRTWMERDILMLSEPEGRERFRAYVRGVIRRVRAHARALSRS